MQEPEDQPQPHGAAPPPHYGYTPPLGSTPPAVWTWFIVYCVFMALLYLLVMGAGAALLVVSPQDLDMEPMEAKIMGSVYLGLGGALLAVFGAAPLLPKRKWVWVYDLVLICLGMTSCCTLPACIPLLIFWIKPETKRLFGW